MHKLAFSESNDSPASRAHTRAPSLEAHLPGVACSNLSRVQKGPFCRSADDFKKYDHRNVLARHALGGMHPCDLPTGSGRAKYVCMDPHRLLVHDCDNQRTQAGCYGK